MAKVWSKRFDNALDPFIEKFNASIGFDRKLILEDLDCSIAHAKMLGKTKVLSSSEASKIINGLELIKVEYLEGKFSPGPPSEDIHYCIEEKLISLIGETGKKLHTGRSRNDQVGTDIRLWLRKEIDNIEILITDLQKSFLNLAKSNIYTLIPGYTHMQRAQPLSLAHHLLAYIEMLQRDRERYKEVRSRVNISPLGAAALAGTKIKIDRHFTAAELGFKKIYKNSIDAVSDRDFVLELASTLAIMGIHLSRMCEEIILWTSSQFNYVELSDEVCTGSSIMPQKKNPDGAELVRGKTSIIISNLSSMLNIIKGLPLSYSKDLQDDKQITFNSYDNVSLCIKVMNEILSKSTFNKTRMKELIDNSNATATDLANWLVQNLRYSFRDAYVVTGKIVSYCSKQDRNIDSLSLGELKKFDKNITADAKKVLSATNSVKSKSSFGGTAPEITKKMIKLVIKKYL